MMKLCCTGGKNLECGDLSPLSLLWRLVAKAGTRPAARESWTPSRNRRRQVACRKRGQVRALQRGCGFAALWCVFPCSVKRLAGTLAPQGQSAVGNSTNPPTPAPSPHGGGGGEPPPPAPPPPRGAG